MPSQGMSSSLVRASLWPISRLFRTGKRYKHATIYRLLRSKHVWDIQLIIALSLFAAVLAVCAGVFIWARAHLPFDAAAVKCLKYGAPAAAVFGGILSWAYKTGSSRLGVVDLFACEISTLCKVTTVVGTVHLWIQRVRTPPAAQLDQGEARIPGMPQFTSAEEYFPVFASNNSALQALEADVVINITAFYTYMKTFRDSLRAMSQIAVTPGAWHTAATNSIYMLFLALESARHAINDLVEFEPDQVERKIVVLLSELEAFEFLRGYYPVDDMHHKRIELRVPDYTAAVPGLREEVNNHKDPDWEPARVLLDELDRRFREAIPEKGLAAHG